eukprot:14657641-Ditylum_brightwellii.AAC.1
MNDSRTMIQEIVKDILQAELKEILPEIVATILQQIKESTNQSLQIVKDVPGQTKPTNTDNMSVLTQTTQGASNESSLDSEAITPSESEEEAVLLTQEDAEKQRNKNLTLIQIPKSNQSPKKLNPGKFYCCKIDALHESMVIPQKQVRTRRRLTLREKVHNKCHLGHHT